MPIDTLATTEAEILTQARHQLDQRRLGHVIGGQVYSDHMSASGGDPTSREEGISVFNPANGEQIAVIPAGGAAEVDQAVSAARAALAPWRKQTPADRATVLLKVADVVEAHSEELAALESLNTGKPLPVAREEVPGVCDVFRYTAGAARALQSPATDEYVAGHVSMIRREPWGVVGGITPWNYPLLTAAWKIAIALATGNTMVLKPSELTPLTLLRFMDLISDVLPAGVLNVVLGTGPEVGSAISRHPGIDFVSLTGSVGSGQQVVSDSVATLKPTHLELGGKAPVIVFDDADLDLVVEGVRFAGFWNTGQECGAGTRILCAESVMEDLTRRLVDTVKSIATGAPDEGEQIEMGPLISAVHRDRVHAAVERARKAGATIALGGDAMDRPGFFYPPTVIAAIPEGDEILTEEISGPVVTIEPFTDEDEVVRRANDVRYGLSASVWTSQTARAFRVSDALDFGTVWINSHLVTTCEMPWGGYGASGQGRELSTLSLDDFSRTKHVMFATGADK